MNVEEFIERALAAGTDVRRVADEQEARAEVLRLVAGRPALVDQTPLLAGLAGARTAGDPWDAAIGVSEAFSAAAEAGTVALVQRAGSPRRTSLLPQHHVVVLPAERVRSTYQAMVDEVAALDPPPTGVQIVSGASRSGDIESAMIRGMHGPRQVTIVVVG